jgi:hypothetical protein
VRVIALCHSLHVLRKIFQRRIEIRGHPEGSIFSRPRLAWPTIMARTDDESDRLAFRGKHHLLAGNHPGYKLLKMRLSGDKG